MKIIITESQFKQIINEELTQSQPGMVNPRLVYARFMKALSMGSIDMADAVKYPDNFQGNLKASLQKLVNFFLNKNQQNADQMQTNNKETVKPEATSISNNALSQICKWETRHDFGYQMQPKDLNGYYNRGESRKTYGYGLRTHPNGKYMEDVKQTWTQPELEQLFKQKISNEVNWVLNWANKNGVKLGQGQLDAMVSAVYNYGRTGFLRTGIPAMIAQNQNDPKIPEVWAHASDNRKNMGGLQLRRGEEAKWYQSDLGNVA